MKPAKKAKKEPVSLVQFMLAKRRAGCPVCVLPADLLAQMVDGRKKKFRRIETIEWLEVAYGIKLKTADFDAHYSGRHESG